MQYHGLSAAQVIKNREKFGANVLPQPKIKTVWNFLGDVFSDKLNLILVFLAVIFVVVAALGLGSMIEAIGIIAVLALIAVIDVFTGMRAQKYMRILQNAAAVRHCNVVRDNKIYNINVTDIVVDDIVLLNTGDTIHADGYLIDGELQVDNSVLNGESRRIAKSVVDNYKYSYSHKITGDDYIDQNSLFAGATIQSGRGMMIVKRVGINTENGKIMSSIGTLNAPKTSLDMQLDKLAMQISRLGIVGAIVVGVCLLSVDIMQVGGWDVFISMGNLNALSNILGVMLIALTIVAAAVPEGLPLIVSLVISQNAREMVRRNVLAKYANKIPEAGNINILCTDKTGTLTYANLMPVSNFLGDGTEIKFDDDCKTNELFLYGVILNSGASYDADGKAVGGNSTGRALLNLIPRDGVMFTKLRDGFLVRDELPFDSANKYSATQIAPVENTSKSLTLYMGAPELVLAHVTHYMDCDGKIKKLRHGTIQKLIQENSARAMRMVATAYADDKISKRGLPDNLTLVCVTALRDEIRKGVPASVDMMHDANVQVVMVTGDALDTAIAIAHDAHIMHKDSDDIALSATELDAMTDDAVVKILPRLRVVARAVPTTKLRLVRAAQARGLCIGMCGDGTNDAPALKLADVGFAMGAGTDVAKAASDIIITDNNFISVTDAVMLGRTFLHNIKMFLRFQLPINIWLMLLCVCFPLFTGEPAFWATQILIINIIMDSLNSLAFGGEPSKPEYMQEPVVQKGAPLISRRGMHGVLWTVLGFAVLFGMLNISSVANVFAGGGEMETARFVLLIFAAMLNGLNIRTDNINVFSGLRHNLMFIVIMAIVFCATVLMVQFGGQMFHVVSLNTYQWFTVFALAGLILPWGTLVKLSMAYK